MFDSEGDAMSLMSSNSRIPSLVVPEGATMTEFYGQMYMQQHPLPFPAPSSPASPASAASSIHQRLQRRSSAGSIMSEGERLFGWSGSKGGVSNAAMAPRYRISSSGHVVLVDPVEEIQPPEPEQGDSSNPAPSTTTTTTTTTTAGQPIRPALKTPANDSAKPSKPMYRPAFAPATELPPSSDEEDLDRVIVHDLPKSGSLKPRASLKQKLGSLVARVGSVRNSKRAARGASTSPPLPMMVPPSGEAGTLDDNNDVMDDDEKKPTAVQQDYISVKKIAFITGASQSASNLAPKSASVRRPELSRVQSLAMSRSSSGRSRNGQSLYRSIGSTASLAHEDNVIHTADGGMYQGGVVGFVGLARRLSRRATTGGPPSPAQGARARAIAEERAKEAIIADKKAAEAMLRAMADIPLYEPPKSARVPNAGRLSSYPPRKPLKTSTVTNDNEKGSPFADSAKYHSKQVKDYDSPKDLGRAKSFNTPSSRHIRNDSTSPSVASSTAPLLSTSTSLATIAIPREDDGNPNAKANDENVPLVRALPELPADAPNTFNWKKTNTNSESANSLAAIAEGRGSRT